MKVSIKNFEDLCKTTKNLEDFYKKYHIRCTEGRITDIALIS